MLHQLFCRLGGWSTLGLVFLGCAHATGVQACPAPCAEGNQRVMRDMEDDLSVTHEALYGTDTAPPNVLNPPADAYAMEDGVKTVLLQSGTGTVHARLKDRVVVTYTGWSRARGERYDASELRGGKETMTVASMVPGLVPVVAMMVAGEKRRIWVPGHLAYGSTPPEGKPAGDIVVDLQIHDVIVIEDAPAAPADVASPPPSATRTASGLAYQVLKKGNGKRPTDFNVVKVHYTGWTATGQVFDSSIPRGEPTELSVKSVIPGWQEALLLMVEGDKLRLWIPANLAYGETPQRPGAPAGQLCFDVELIQVQ